MYADMVEIPQGHPWDQYAMTCPEDTCALRTESGPWTYHITRELVDVPGHGEARFVDAEKAWAGHVQVHHEGRTAQHRRHPPSCLDKLS